MPPSVSNSSRFRRKQNSTFVLLRSSNPNPYLARRLHAGAEESLTCCGSQPRPQALPFTLTHGQAACKQSCDHKRLLRQTASAGKEEVFIAVPRAPQSSRRLQVPQFGCTWLFGYADSVPSLTQKAFGPPCYSRYILRD